MAFTQEEIAQFINDKGLNKNKDFLSKFDEITTGEVAQDDSFFGNLGAGSYSALNEALLGLPDLLVKLGGSGVTDYIKQLRASHKLASDIGGGAGLVGSMLLPGGLAAKVVGKGAQLASGALRGANAISAAEKVANVANMANKTSTFLRGATPLTGVGARKVGQAIGRAAAQTAEQTVPRFLIEGADTGDWGKAATNAAINQAAGTGLGAAFTGIASKFAGRPTLGGNITAEAAEELGTISPLASKVEGVRDLANQMTIASAGGTTRAVNRAMRRLYGNNPVLLGKKVEEYEQILADGINKYKLKGDAGWKNLDKINKENWQQIDDFFNKGKPANWNTSFKTKILNDPELSDIATSSGESTAPEIINSISKVFDGTYNLGAIRSKLNEIIRANSASTVGVDRIKAKIALTMKSKLDDFVTDTADAAGAPKDLLKNAKETHLLSQPLIIAGGIEAGKIPNLEGLGSPTFEKIEANKLISSLLNNKVAMTAGVGTIGGGYSVAQDISQEKDVDILKALALMGAGSGVGFGINKVLPKLLSILPSTVARGTSKWFSKKPGREEKIVDNLTKIVNEVPHIAAVAPAILGLSESARKTSDPVESANTAKKIELATPPAQAQKSKQEYFDNISPYMKNELNKMYQKHYRDMDPEEFLQRVMVKTNNFTDMVANADFMFDDDLKKAEFINKYNTYMSVKNLELLDKQGKAGAAIKGGGGFNLGPLGTIGGDEKAAEQQAALKELLLQAKTEGDITKRPAAIKSIEKSLAEVAQNPSLLPQLLKGYGITPSELEGWVL